MHQKLQKNISYRLKFTDRAGFMTRSRSNLTNNFVERISKFRCKYRHDDKNVKLEIGDKYCECILEYTNGANDLT